MITSYIALLHVIALSLTILENKPVTTRSPRAALLHYHLFKNAGTSLDLILKENFKGEWTESEFPNDDFAGPVARQIENWIRQAPDKIAFSTHTGKGPLPEIENRTVIPLILIRHPLDRMLSAYNFERQQKSESFGARLAKEETFEGYVMTRLENLGDRSCRNFHTHRLAPLALARQEGELETALQALQELPWVGLVEAFEPSLEKLQEVLTPYFPSFKCRKVHSNASNNSSVPIAAKIQQIKAEFGSAFFDRLMAENQDDFVLYEQIKKAYNLS